VLCRKLNDLLIKKKKTESFLFLRAEPARDCARRWETLVLGRIARNLVRSRKQLAKIFLATRTTDVLIRIEEAFSALHREPTRPKTNIAAIYAIRPTLEIRCGWPRRSLYYFGNVPATLCSPVRRCALLGNLETASTRYPWHVCNQRVTLSLPSVGVTGLQKPDLQRPASIMQKQRCRRVSSRR